VFGIIKRELRRRSAIEAVIGHMKGEGHLGRCYLKGRDGDAANAILTAVGHNLRLVLTWLRIILRLIPERTLARLLVPNRAQSGFLTADSIFYCLQSRGKCLFMAHYLYSRSVRLGPELRPTKVALERAFWDVLEQIAQQQRITMSALIRAVDQAKSRSSLASVLRVFALQNRPKR